MVLIVFCDHLVLYEMNFNIGNIKTGHVISKVQKCIRKKNFILLSIIRWLDI